MSGKLSGKIDPYRRLRFNDLEPTEFELFFHRFLTAGIELEVKHHGQAVLRKIIHASTYAAGSGRDQKGIDLVADTDQGERWVFQCKRHKAWNQSQTRISIEEARQYKAHHYFLVVSCGVGAAVHDEVDKHGDWTLWNHDCICEQFKQRVPQSRLRHCLEFLTPDEFKQFIPFSTRALISPEQFFARFLDSANTFRHDWALVGREEQLANLYAFLADPKQVVMLTAKGGDGKSRLLWEFCRELPNRTPGSEVLCLNPQHLHDNPEFAFLNPATPKVIIVDDAHRTENVPMSLLNLVRESKAKLVLATRPQGVEPLSLKLFDAGLQNSINSLSLPALKSADVLALARQVLGDASEEQVKTLAGQTKDSPFLTVIAGDLIRRGKLQWSGDVSAEEFRREVFRAFEAENLRHVSDAERPLWQNLLRLIALLAPVEDPVAFAEKAAGCLGTNVVDIEDRLSRLRATELVVGHPNKLRVVPDLFADFLVYDACFEPAAAKPAFVRQVVRAFTDHSPAMLRNLAEAAWIARRNGVADAQFLGALLTAEFERFEAVSFYQRARIVEHWSRFGVFLPAESLELTRRAIALKTAAPDLTCEYSLWKQTRLDTHSYVLQHLPPLLKPVAIYHAAHRRAALDLLWELGLALDWKAQANNQNHPWAAIADVMKFEPEKLVLVTTAALDWLTEKVRQAEVLKALEDPAPVLRTLLAPCFANLVESRWMEGRTLHLRTSAASLANTLPIRDRALSVIRHVVEHGSWLAALDALSALEAGYQRIAKIYEGKVEDLAQFRLEWRPERLKALELLREMLARHEHTAVRYSVRKSLKGMVAYEEDSVVKDEVRGILRSIRDDLDLQITLTLLCYGLEDYDEEVNQLTASDDYSLAHSQWQRKVTEMARELVASRPEPKKLFVYLDQLVSDLVRSGESPHTHSLYTGLVQAAPRLAVGLAGEILAAASPTFLVSGWPILVSDNPVTDPQQRLALFETAAGGTDTRAKDSMVEHVSWRLRSKDNPLSDAEMALIEKLAARADAGLAVRFLRLVRRADGPNRDWAWNLLSRLPLGEVARQSPDQLTDLLRKHRDEDALPPGHVVRHVLARLVEAPRLDFHHGGETWSQLKQEYAKEIYDLVVARIEREATDTAPNDYDPIPDDWPSSFDLPELQTHPAYAAICDELWRRVTNPTEPKRYYWTELFKAVVLQDASNWLSHLHELVQTCSSVKVLKLLVGLVRFGGSLVIFRQPEFTRRVLQRAENLGGQATQAELRSSLYNTAGPQVRSSTNGQPDRDTDYVEAAAARAAEAHTDDSVLGPFYRWIVEVEQRNRVAERAKYEANNHGLEF